MYLKNSSSVQSKLCGIRYILLSSNLNLTLIMVGLILTIPTTKSKSTTYVFFKCFFDLHFY